MELLRKAGETFAVRLCGHNPPPPVVFLSNASIEVAGEEHKRPRLKKRRWAALSPSNRISDRVTGARNVPAGQRDVAR